MHNAVKLATNSNTCSLTLDSLSSLATKTHFISTGDPRCPQNHTEIELTSLVDPHPQCMQFTLPWRLLVLLWPDFITFISYL
jgi:hypothetical protein